MLSNASPQITFLELIPEVRSAWGWWGLGMLESPIHTASHSQPLHRCIPPQEQLPKDFVQRIRQVDTRSPVTKINGRYQQGHFRCHPCWRNTGARLSKRLHPTSSISPSYAQWRWIGCPASWLPPMPTMASPCPTTSAPYISTARAPSSCTRHSLRPPTGTPPAGRSLYWHTLVCWGRDRTVMAVGAGQRGVEWLGAPLPAQLVYCFPRPMIELCIPSALDPGLAPPGCHVVSLFTQYTPSVLAGGRSWDEQARNAYADTGT